MKSSTFSLEKHAEGPKFVQFQELLTKLLVCSFPVPSLSSFAWVFQG